MGEGQVYWVVDRTGLLPSRMVCVSRSVALVEQEAVRYQRAHPACSVFIEVWKHGVCQEIHRTIVWPPAEGGARRSPTTERNRP